MKPHRAPGPLAALPRRAPWWRILRAIVDGTMLKIRDRRFRHAYGIVRDPAWWARRFPVPSADLAEHSP